MNPAETIQRGVALALEARKRRWLDDAGLALVFAYYDNEGQRDPLPPGEVLVRLAGLDPERARELLANPVPVAEQRAFGERHVVLDTLGEGGMGSVYRAYDRVLRRVVAVKVIRRELLGSSRELQRAEARFQREAQVMARVGHPAIVGIHDVGVSGEGEPFLVMEFVEGRTLSDLVAEQPGELEPSKVLAWCQHVAEGLEACHQAGVVHRDVKPSNIMIDADGQAHLTDFGIALDGEAHTKLTQSVVALGTLSYMPPEQAAGRATDGRSDVYALGATLFEALTGEPVFTASSVIEVLALIVKRPPPPPRSRRPDLSADAEAVILQCLAKEPDDRYPSAGALADDLERLLTGQPVEAQGARRAPALGTWLRARALLLLLLLGGLLLAGGVGAAGVFWLRGQAAQQAARQATAQEDRGPALTTRAPPEPEQETPDASSPGLQLVKVPGREEWTNPKDGSVFVRVEPATFTVGSDPQFRMLMEQPRHRVTITKPFFISKHEISWKQFRRFCEETGHPEPEPTLSAATVYVAQDDHPVFNLKIADARAYCRWAGLRLPTGAEWELAAGGPRDLVFPWGNEFPLQPALANVADASGKRLEIVDYDTNTGRYAGYDDGVPFLAPVDSFPAGASPCGALHMAGNVSEWVADAWHDYTPEAKVDPPAVTEGASSTMRGGAWCNSWWAARTSVRMENGGHHRNAGLRPAYSPPAEDE